MLATASHLHKTFGLHTVLNDVSLSLLDGDRIGLVGANGSGKTTLLRLIAGELSPDSGAVSIPAGVRVGYLQQMMLDIDGRTVSDMIDRAVAGVRAAEGEMRRLEAAMTTAAGEVLSAVLHDYGTAADAFEQGGGYELDHRIDATLAGLGVGHISRDRLFSTLSGGEKERMALALLLLNTPDLLLLDEPTNHLDASSLDWLEATLSAYPGGALIVSHDRAFLNRTVNAIIEIDEHRHTAKRYGGDYDAYRRAKEIERRRWQEEYARQQEEIKALRYDVAVRARNNDNYRPPPDGDKFLKFKKEQTHDRTVAKRVRSAEERLRRIEEDPIPQPPEDLCFDGRLDPAALRGRLPLIVRGLSKRYGDRVILEEVSFEVGVDARIALVAPNGAGKTTLIRLLTGQETPDAGEVVYNPAVQVGFIDQESADLPPESTLFEAYRRGIDREEQALMTILLHSGLFRYADVHKKVPELSGGQRRKVQIARLIAGGANLLILDEPTNYVSFDVLEALEDALRAFPGPVIAASHDRRFLERFGGDRWTLDRGRLVR
ncbi:MAG: ATP-binding cassette domain-containing protein [Anaerolineae bacterium]|nr:ATP-binding cassette domain-containing protein [Anaerolineae bacterium]NUQ04943.1 ABC-F family ATP-binding cassette domain-containing protein [Anaerolineae bacterium]